MDKETGPARDSVTAGSTLADQLVTLIMSGTKPTVGADDTHDETDPAPAPLLRVIRTPANDGTFWTYPPTASRRPQPRVDAFFVRGPAQYQTHDAAAPEHDDTSSTLSDAEPQLRSIGSAITYGANGDDVSGSTQPAAPLAALAALAALVEGNISTQPSILTAAIEPYVRSQPDTAAQETVDRDEAGRVWHKA